MNDIVQSSFPLLQSLITHILDNNNHTLEAAQVMKLILKIFWSATMYALPTVQGVDVNAWFQILGMYVCICYLCMFL